MRARFATAINDQVSLESSGETWEVVGAPDFLVPREGGHIVRDVKVARRVAPSERPDIAAQLQVYAWLYQQVCGVPPVRAEVVSGAGHTEEIPLADSDSPIISRLNGVARIKSAIAEPYCPVKYSGSRSCPYFDRCWQDALDRSDPCTVPGVSARLAIGLRETDVRTVEDLRQLSVDELAQFEVPLPKRTRRVGHSRAEKILRAAESLETSRVIRHGALELPKGQHAVVLDLEASPTLGGRKGLVYLWGTCVKGPSPMAYHAAFAEPGDEASGWQSFLARAREIFDRYERGIPFLHWAAFEKTHLRRCIEAYGDPDGIGALVVRNLVDLYRMVIGSLTLPIRSYSLKEVEKLVGFERSQKSFGGDWSIAVWEEATSAATDRDREIPLQELALYNEEDLEALWCVFEWLLRWEAQHPDVRR